MEFDFLFGTRKIIVLNMDNLLIKLRIYGLRKFIIYSFSEIVRKIWLGGVMHRYSQKGEDYFIHKLLKFKKRGFYVDIGTNDPVRFNNTKYFYDRGWKGINIEPDVNCFRKIEKIRTRDINLNLGIGNANSELTFFQFIPDTLSTFSAKDAERYKRQGYTYMTKKKILVKKLSAVFEKYLGNKKVDFMTIDTEGYDREVLASNDWSKYRPKIICIESVEHLINGSGKDTGLEKLLIDKKYKKIWDNGINSIYLDDVKI